VSVTSSNPEIRQFDGSDGSDGSDAQELLRHHAQVLELLAAGAPRNTVLDAVTGALEELAPGSRCSVLLFDPRTGTLHHGSAPSLPFAYVAEIDGIAIGPQAGSCGTAAHRRAPVIVADVEVDPLWAEYRAAARLAGVRACWSAPILGRDGRLLGTFAVYYDHPREPTEREARLVARFTHLAAIAMDHAALFGTVQESEERFRRAFEDNAVGMALLSPEGLLLRVNAALCRMFGRSQADLVGKPLRAFADLDDARLPPCDLPSTAAMHVECRFQRADGTTMDAATTFSAVRDPEGSIIHICANIVDETARRAAERDRQARAEAEVARLAAERASQAKSRFLTALGHEIRTPLNAIVGFAELLQTLDLPPARRAEALNRIHGGGQHLLAVVEDLADIAAIEAGALRLETAAVDPAVVIDEVCGLVGPLADEVGVTVRPHPGDPGLRARCDQRRLAQVLLNLVSNAIKFNRRGGLVEVRAIPMGEEHVALDTSDNGPGIADDLRQRAFIPYDRLGAEHGDVPGSGLGLALSRALVEGMGGTLSLHTHTVEGGILARVLLDRAQA
jgi:PAS domain S-box-containing protein